MGKSASVRQPVHIGTGGGGGSSAPGKHQKEAFLKGNYTSVDYAAVHNGN